MPDDSDYEWLGWLVEHPEKWSKEDLSAARSMLANQKRVLAGAHPKDHKGRRSAQESVEGLEAAIQSYLARRA